MPSPALVGVERCKDRARKHRLTPERQIDRATGQPKLPEMRPQPVVLTLADEMAPSVTVIPSVHETTVVLPPLQGQKVGKELAKLKPGEGATFQVTGTKKAGQGDDERVVLVWERVKGS